MKNINETITPTQAVQMILNAVPNEWDDGDYETLINKQLFLTALKENPGIFKYAQRPLIEDRQFVLLAVEASPGNLCEALEQFRDDEEIVLTSLKGVISRHEKHWNEKVEETQTARNEVLSNALNNPKIASTRIQEIFKNRDPIKALEAAVYAKKLNKELAHKKTPKQSTRIKI